jgi:hypothetical protein
MIGSGSGWSFNGQAASFPNSAKIPRPGAHLVVGSHAFADSSFYVYLAGESLQVSMIRSAVRGEPVFSSFRLPFHVSTPIE